MSGTITISVDAMGGDNAPRATILGAKLLLREQPNTRFLFHGRESEITPLLDEYPELKAVSEVRHNDNVITMEDKPSQALRKGRGNSSMWNAIQSVKDREAQVVISGGNTGALMAMSTFCLRPVDGISRPAIAAIWPTLRSETVVLDVGATIGADAEQLVDFSILGAALARALFNSDNPTVGLLNVGEEEVKGTDAVKGAAKILSEGQDAGFSYFGFVEGDDLGKGTVDVIVTEGFTGNVALKTAEGTARQVGTYVSRAMKSSIWSKIGALIAYSAFKSLKNRMDPRTVNGGVFLGLNGVVIKSHGGTDEIGYKSALILARSMASQNLIEKISDGVKRMRPDIAETPSIESEAPSA